jgi:3,4-dihydroxy 2-butanone 4-phosphate synthase/GTP cyclohydrolase II
MHPTDANRAYLETKRDRMGHDLPDLGDPTVTTEELHQ